MRKPTSFWSFTHLGLSRRKPRRRQPSTRRLRCEQLETRNLLAADGWYNAETPADVNADGTVTPVDALLVANVIYENDGDSVTLEGENSEDVFLDVNNDGQIGESDFAAVVSDAGIGAAPVTPPPATPPSPPGTPPSPPGTPPSPPGTPGGGGCDTTMTAQHYAYGDLEVSGAWASEGEDLAFYLQVVNGSVGCGVEVAYHTEDGSAKSVGTDVGEPDFTAVIGGTIVIPMGAWIKSIKIGTTEDDVVEHAETMNLVIDSITPINGTEMFEPALSVKYATDYSAVPFVANPGHATGVIRASDRAEVIFTVEVFNAAGNPTDNKEGPAGEAKTARVTATLSKPVAGPVTVDYEDVADSYGHPSPSDGDYGMTDGTLSIPGAVRNPATGLWEPGSAFFEVTINGDDKVELDEIVRIEFSNLDAGGLSVGFEKYVDAQGNTKEYDDVAIRIANDDQATVRFERSTEIENEENGQIAFDLILDREVDVPVTVDFASAAGTAQVGADYSSAAGSHVAFSGGAGEVQTLSVSIVDDDIVEANEEFSLQITNIHASGRNVAGGAITTSKGRILNVGDVADISIIPELPWPLNWQLERDTMNSEYEFRVRLSRQVDAAVTVYYMTLDGTATAGADYVAKSGSIVIPAYTPTSSNDHLIKITIKGDLLDEWDESYKVKITGDDDGGGGGRNVTESPEATAYIKDDD